MMHTTGLIVLLASVAGLSACGDKPQTMGGASGDVAAFQGVDNKYAAPGWKAGDRASWEQALKARALNTQNEYSKTTSR